jgi:hypothetical protein
MRYLTGLFKDIMMRSMVLKVPNFETAPVFKMRYLSGQAG